MEKIYAHARRALYAKIEAGVINDACEHSLRVRSRSASRDDYLVHPPTGEAFCDKDAQRVRGLHATRRPQLQICISDGLNADAINENLRAVLPALRRQLAENNFHVGTIDLVIDNGRVRAGYHAGALLDVEALIHLIGERPGTGLNTLSAYLTYGRDRQGNSRWHVGIDHSQTTAICGIHPQGKPPEIAVAEIVRTVKRMFEHRASGVVLGVENKTR
jgi:ethanolamine ammonia-lyase large subunit